MVRKASTAAGLAIMAAAVMLLVPLGLIVHQVQGADHASEATDPGTAARISGQEGATGTSLPDDSVEIDKYKQAYKEIDSWLGDGKGVPAIVDGLPIQAVGIATGIELFIGISEDAVDQIDEVREKFQQLYPELNIVVDTVGFGEWAAGSTCTSADGCLP